MKISPISMKRFFEEVEKIGGGDVEYAGLKSYFRVRITGGEWRGRRLKPMKSFKVDLQLILLERGLFNLLRSSGIRRGESA